MKPDDVVIYTQKHFEWLLDSNMWPSKHVPREALKGRVLAAGVGLVEVLWNQPPLYKETNLKHYHFSDNLEIFLPDS